MLDQINSSMCKSLDQKGLIPKSKEKETKILVKDNIFAIEKRIRINVVEKP